METKNTNLDQLSDNKKQSKNSIEESKSKNKNEKSRIFNAGELSEKNQNRVTGQAGAQVAGTNQDDSSIPTEPQREEWNKNEKARDDEKMYVTKDNKKDKNQQNQDLRDEEALENEK